ncbi:hypothetical protein ACLKA6_014602 [Drosophila palustris]
MPLGRQSAYRLQCAHTSHVTHEQHKDSEDNPCSCNRLASFRQHASIQRPQHEEEERKQSEDMLNRCPRPLRSLPTCG